LKIHSFVFQTSEDMDEIRAVVYIQKNRPEQTRQEDTRLD